MPTYYMNEGAFDLLEAGFVDRTTHDLTATLEGGEALELSVARAPIPEDKTLLEVVAAHLAEEAKKRAGFSVLHQMDAEVAGLPAISVRVRWRDDRKIVYQHQAHLALFDAWMTFALRAPLGLRDACDAELAEILATVRLRD